MSATLKQAIDTIAAETAWRERDLVHRVRWCQEAKRPLIRKRRPGTGAKDANRVTAPDLITILLSLASPEGTAAPKWVPVYAGLKAEDFDGKKLWTLRDKLYDIIDTYMDGEKFMKATLDVDRILLIFDEDWPTAEISWHPRSKDGKRLPVSHTMNFTPEPPGPNQLPGQYSKATVINGGIFSVFADLLKDEELVTA